MAIGKISPITNPPSGKIKNMTNSLAAAGRTLYPGTGVYYFPQKTSSGRYITGLDEDAPELNAIADKHLREEEKKRIKEKRERLEKATGYDLGPFSNYWNYSLYTHKDRAHTQGYKLKDSDNIFNFTDPEQEIAFTWLKNCDTIAPSYESYVRGDKGPDVRFYVHDDEIENKRKYDRKKSINKAVVANDALSPDKRKKIAFLMGLEVTDNAPEDVVYNIIDDQLKETEFKSGKFKGLSPVNMFMNFVDLDNKILNNKFLVEEALKYNVYRKRSGGALYEGEIKVADSSEDLVNKLCDDDNQEQLIALQKQVRSKKLAIA